MLRIHSRAAEVAAVNLRGRLAAARRDIREALMPLLDRPVMLYLMVRTELALLLQPRTVDR